MGSKCCKCSTEKAIASNSSIDSYPAPRPAKRRSRLSEEVRGMEGETTTTTDWARPDGPPFLSRRLTDQAVKVGTRTRLLVEIASSSPLTVVWLQNGKKVEECERIKFINEGNFYCADISPVTMEDEGTWSVQGHNARGLVTSQATLTLVVPRQYKMPEFVEPLRAVLGAAGTVSLETKVIGIPTPTLKWYKDDEEIKPGDVLGLTPDPRDPSLGTYTCIATNCMGSAVSTSRVHVVSPVQSHQDLGLSTSGPKPIFAKELRNEKIKIGGTLNLECQVKVPPWPDRVSWYNSEGEVKEGPRAHLMEDGLGGYAIRVSPIQASDDGSWRFVATNRGGATSVTTANVSVSYPKNYRKPKFLDSLKAVLTEEGLVSFECKVVGYPTPQLSWFKDGQELKPGDVYQLTGTNSLGSYCCIARNCMGEAESTAVLTVEDIQSQLTEEERLQLFSDKLPPKFIQGLKSMEAKISDPFTFTVKVSVSPEPTILWFRDDEHIDEGESRYKVEKDKLGLCFLHISRLEFADQAEWKCVAMNDFGQSVTSAYLKLNIPRHYKKPKFLEELRAVLSDEGAVNLECKVIGVPQPVLKWFKDGKELKPGDIHRIISGQDGSCCLGTYTCMAQNCMGTVSSSASLLGFQDKSITGPGKVVEKTNTCLRDTSLSTIQEERTSQMHDTDRSLTLDDRPEEVSFSFDGREVSVSLYETPDLTEEEALQIVEMYADQISEHVSEHNVVELPPMRFTKESSTSGKLLMEAMVIDVSPDYFTPGDVDDLRTDADLDEFSMVEEAMVTPDEERGEAEFPTSPDERDDLRPRGTERSVPPTPRDEKVRRKKKKSTDSEKEDDSLQEFERRKSEKRTFKERRRTESEMEDDSLYEFESRKAIGKGFDKSKEAKTEKEITSETGVEFGKSGETPSVFKTAEQMTGEGHSKVQTSMTEADLTYETAEDSAFDKSEISVLESLAHSLHEIQRGLANVEAQAISEAQEIRSPQVSILESLAVPLADVQRSLEVMEEKLDEGLIGSEVLETLVQPINEFKRNLRMIEEEEALQRRASSIMESLAKPLQELEKEIAFIQEQCYPRRYSSEERYAKTVEEVQETLTRIIERQESVPHDRKLMKTISVELQELEETASDDLEKYYDRLLACGSEIRKKLLDEDNQEIIDVLRSISDLVKPMKHLTAVTSKCISVIVKDYESQGVPSAKLVESLIKPLEALKSSLDLLESVSGLKSHRAIRGVGIPLLYKLSVPMEELETTIKLVENLSAHTAVEFLVPPLENLIKVVSEIDISSGGDGFLENLPVDGPKLLRNLEGTMGEMLNSIGEIKSNAQNVESEKQLIEKLPNIVKPMEELQKSLKPIEEGIGTELSYDDVCELAQNLSKPLQSLRSELSILQHEIEIEQYGDITGEKKSALSDLIQPLEALQTSISSFHESVLCKEDPIHLRFVLYALKEMQEPLKYLSSKIAQTEEAIVQGKIIDPHSGLKNVSKAVRELRETSSLTKTDLPTIYNISSLLAEPLELVEVGLADVLEKVSQKESGELNINLLKTMSQPLQELQSVLLDIDSQEMLNESEGTELKQSIQDLKHSILLIQDQISFEYGEEPSTLESNIVTLESLVQPLQTMRAQLSEIQRASVRTLIKTDRVLTDIRDASKDIISVISVNKEAEGPLTEILQSLESAVGELGVAADAQNIQIGQGQRLDEARRNMSVVLNCVASTLGEVCAQADDLSVGLEGEKRTALILIQDMVHDLKSAVESTVEVMEDKKTGIEQNMATATALEQLKVAMSEFSHSISGVNEVEIETPKKSVSMDELKEYVVQLERDVNLVIDKISTTVDRKVAQPILDTILNDVKSVKRVVLNMAEERNLDESRITFVLEKVKFIEMDLQELSKDTLKEECLQLNEACKTAQAIVSMQDQLIQTSREENEKTHSDIIETLIENVKSLESVIEKVTLSPNVTDHTEIAKLSENLCILQENILLLTNDEEEVTDFSTKVKDIVLPVKIIEEALQHVQVDKVDLQEAVLALNKISTACNKAKKEVSRLSEFEKLFSTESLSESVDVPLIAKITEKIENLHSEIKPIQDKNPTKLIWFLDSIEESIVKIGKDLSSNINKINDPEVKRNLIETLEKMKSELLDIKLSNPEKIVELKEAIENFEISLNEGPHKVLPALQDLLRPVLNLHENVAIVDERTIKRAETKYLDNCSRASNDLELGLMKLEKALITSDEMDLSVVSKPLQVLVNHVDSISHDPIFEYLDEESNIAQLQAMNVHMSEIKESLVQLEQVISLPEAKGKIENLLVSISKPVRELRHNIALIQEQALMMSVEARASELQDLKEAIAVVCSHVEDEETLKSLVGPVQVLKETLEAACNENLAPEDIEGPVKELKHALEVVESEVQSFAEESVASTVAVPLLDLCHHVVQIIENRVIEGLGTEDNSLSDLATLASLEDVSDNLFQAVPVTVDTKLDEFSSDENIQNKEIVPIHEEEKTLKRNGAEQKETTGICTSVQEEDKQFSLTHKEKEKYEVPQKANVKEENKTEIFKETAVDKSSRLTEKKKKKSTDQGDEKVPLEVNVEAENKKEQQKLDTKKIGDLEKPEVEKKKDELNEGILQAEKKKELEMLDIGAAKERESEMSDTKKKEEKEKSEDKKKKEVQDKLDDKEKQKEEKIKAEKKKEPEKLNRKNKEEQKKLEEEKKKEVQDKLDDNEKQKEDKIKVETKKEPEKLDSKKKEEQKRLEEEKKKAEQDKLDDNEKQKEEKMKAVKKNEAEKFDTKKKEEKEKLEEEKKKEVQDKLDDTKKKELENQDTKKKEGHEKSEKLEVEMKKKPENLDSKKKEENESVEIQQKKGKENLAAGEKKKLEKSETIKKEETSASEIKEGFKEESLIDKKKPSKDIQEVSAAVIQDVKNAKVEQKDEKHHKEAEKSRIKEGDSSKDLIEEGDSPTSKGGIQIRVDENIKKLNLLEKYSKQLESEILTAISKVSQTPKKYSAQPILESIVIDIKSVHRVIEKLLQDKHLDRTRLKFINDKATFIEADLNFIIEDILKAESSELNLAQSTIKTIISLKLSIDEESNDSDIFEKLSILEKITKERKIDDHKEGEQSIDEKVENLLDNEQVSEKEAELQNAAIDSELSYKVLEGKKEGTFDAESKKQENEKTSLSKMKGQEKQEIENMEKVSGEKNIEEGKLKLENVKENVGIKNDGAAKEQLNKQLISKKPDEKQESDMKKKETGIKQESEKSKNEEYKIHVEQDDREKENRCTKHQDIEKTYKKDEEQDKLEIEKKEKEEQEKLAAEKKKKEVEERLEAENKKRGHEKLVAKKKKKEEQEKHDAEIKAQEQENLEAGKQKEEQEKLEAGEKKKAEQDKVNADNKKKEELEADKKKQPGKLEAENKKKEELEKLETEKNKKQEQEKLETEKKVEVELKKKAEQDKREAEKEKREEQDKLKAENKQKEEKEKMEVEHKKITEQEKLETDKKKQQEKLEAEKKKKEEQEKLETENKKEEQYKLEAERLKKEVQEKMEAEKKKEQEKLDAERKKEQEKIEAEKKKKEEQDKLEAEKKKNEEQEKLEAEKKKKEEEEKLEAEKKKKEGQEKLVAEKKKKEEQEKLKAEEKKKEEQEKLEVEKKKKEEQEKLEVEKKKKEEQEKLKAEEKKKEEQEKLEVEKKKKEEQEKLEVEKKKKEEQEKLEVEKKKKEEQEKLDAEKKKKEEQDKLEAEKKKKEEKEKLEAEKKKEKLEAEKKKKEEQDKLEAEKKKKEEQEKLEAEKKKKEEQEKLEAEKKKKEEQDKLEAEKKKKEEQEKLEAEKKEKDEQEKLEAEKKKKDEQEKLVAEKKKKEEQEKLEAEKKKEKEKLEAEKKKEKEKLEAEKKKKEEQDKLEAEKKKKEEQEKLEAEKKKKKEQEKLEAEKKKKEEQEKLEAEKKKKEEQEKLEAEKKKKEEQEKLEAEKKKKEEQEKFEAEKKKKEEQEKLEAEKKKEKLEAEKKKKEEQEKLEAEKKKKEEQEKLEAEKKKKDEQDKLEAEKKKKDEQDKLEAEKKKKEEQEKLEAEKKKKEEQEKLEAEKKKKEEQEKLEAEKKKKEEQEKLEAEKKKKEEQEKLEAEKKKKEEQEKLEAEKKKKEEQEKLVAEKKKKEEQEKLVAEKKKKEEQEKLEAEKKKKEEQEKLEAERFKKEEQEKMEAEKKKKEEQEKLEAERLKKEEQEKMEAEKKKEYLEAEKKKKEEQEKLVAEKKKKEEQEKLKAEKKKKEEQEKLEAEKKKKEDQEKIEAEKKKKEEQEKLEAEKKKKQEQEKLQAENKKKDEQDKLEAEKKKKEEQEKLKAEKKKKEEQEKLEAEKKKKQEQEKLEAEKKKKVEQEKLETEKKKKEEQEKLEAEKKKKEDQEKLKAEKKKKEEQEKLEAERLKKEEQEKMEAEKKKKEHEKVEAEKKKKEEQEKLEAERLKKEEQEKMEAEKKKKEHGKVVAEKKKKEEQDKLEAEKKKNEEQEKMEAEKKKKEEQEKMEAEKKKKEELEKMEAEKKEQEKLDAERKKKEDQEKLKTETKKKEEQDKLKVEMKKKEEQDKLEVKKKKEEEAEKKVELDRLESEKKAKEQGKLESEKKKIEKQEKLDAANEEQEKLVAKKTKQDELEDKNKINEVDMKSDSEGNKKLDDDKSTEEKKQDTVQKKSEHGRNKESEDVTKMRKSSKVEKMVGTEEVIKRGEPNETLLDQSDVKIKVENEVTKLKKLGTEDISKDIKKIKVDESLKSKKESDKLTIDQGKIKDYSDTREDNSHFEPSPIDEQIKFVKTDTRKSAFNGYDSSITIDKGISDSKTSIQERGRQEYSATVESYAKSSLPSRKYLIDDYHSSTESLHQSIEDFKESKLLAAESTKLKKHLSRSGADLSYDYSPKSYLIRDDYSKKDFSSIRSATSEFSIRHYSCDTPGKNALDTLKRRLDRSWRNLNKDIFMSQHLSTGSYTDVNKDSFGGSSDKILKRDHHSHDHFIIVTEDFSPLAQSRRYTRRRSASPLPTPLIGHSPGETTVIRQRSRSRSRYDIIERQPYICSPLRDKRVEHGANVKLTCNIGGEPEPTVQWRKDGQPIESIIDRFIMEYSFGVASLEIRSVIASDAGQYTCVAINSAGQTATTATLRVNTDHWQGIDDYGLSQGISLPLRIPENIPKVRGLIADSLVPTGGLIALHLQVEGCPRAEITWLKEGTPVRYGSRMHTLFDMSMGLHTLLVEGATLAEGGLYHCKVISGAYRLQEPAPAHIQVVERRPGDKPALITARPETRITLRSGEDLTLTCYVSGEPKPRVMLMKGLKDITEGGRTLKESFGEYVRLTLKRALPEDSGTYFIVARNPYGTDRAFSTVKIRERTRSLTPTRSSSSLRESSVYSTSSHLSLTYS